MQGYEQQRVSGWWLEIDNISKSQWPRLERLLEKAEVDRAQRFHFEHDRQSYIAAHALTRALLTTWTGLSPTQWQFTIGPFGKPEVILPPGQPELRVNLSHTRGLVAVVLSDGHDIGVDVEWLERNSDIEGLAKRVFTLEERAILAATPQHQKKQVFLTFWTLKESYIKAIGKGLSHPLDSFYFSLDPLGIHFKSPKAFITSDDPEQWRFQHFQPTPGHLMALAIHHPEPENLVITLEEAPLDAIVRLE
jgi:4'-phosphopantetheinyl transferase